MTPIAPLIAAWLQKRLPAERGASPHTCHSYAYAFQLLFEFAARRLAIAPSELMLEHIDADMVQAFLEHLERDRGNTPRSRNARLAAIRAFMRFVEYRVPSALDQVRVILAIPMHRFDSRVVPHLDRIETQALLDAPDPTTRTGIRDRALLYLAVTSGMRVSELVGLKMTELSFRDNFLELRIFGKGRKERALTLWKAVSDCMRAWLAIRGSAPAPEVFLNARREPLTRSGAEYILKKYAKQAGKSCPTLTQKPVSPHVLRHTCAVNVLRATGDIRKVALWLGHANLQTSEIYLQADASDRLDVLNAVVPPGLKKGSFSPPDKLIALLRGR